MSTDNVVVAFKPAADNIVVNDGVERNAAGLPRLTDDEHFRRAIASDTPHSYISARAGRIAYEGEEGIGALNAETLHIRLLRQPGYMPDIMDIDRADKMNASMRGAIMMLARLHRDDFKRVEATLPLRTLPAPERDYHY